MQVDAIQITEVVVLIMPRGVPVDVLVIPDERLNGGLLSIDRSCVREKSSSHC